MNHCPYCFVTHNRKFSEVCFSCENASNEFAKKNVQHVEDKSRFFRNTVDGSDYSHALGTRMPDNRTERNKLYERLGAEPVTPGTMPAQWKEDREYAEHVKNGGQREGFKQIDISGGEKVIDKLRKGDIRIPS